MVLRVGADILRGTEAIRRRYHWLTETKMTDFVTLEEIRAAKERIAGCREGADLCSPMMSPD
jgi:hypothetical protein